MLCDKYHDFAFDVQKRVSNKIKELNINIGTVSFGYSLGEYEATFIISGGTAMSMYNYDRGVEGCKSIEQFDYCIDAIEKDLLNQNWNVERKKSERMEIHHERYQSYGEIEPWDEIKYQTFLRITKEE